MRESDRVQAVCGPPARHASEDKGSEKASFGVLLTAAVFLTSKRLSISVPTSCGARFKANPRGKFHLMKRLILILAAFSLALPLFGQEKSPQLKDQKDKVSYSIGLNIGFNLGRQNVPDQSRRARRRHKGRDRGKTSAYTRSGQGDHGGV